MNDARMTIRLPSETLAFAREHAAKYGMTLTELVIRYFDRLRDGVASPKTKKPRKDISKYVGILHFPNMTDEELDKARYEYLKEKYL